MENIHVSKEKYQNPFTVESLSEEAEFEQLLKYLSEDKTKFFLKNNYKIVVPKIDIFQELAAGEVPLVKVNQKELRKVFDNEEYTPLFYQKGQEAIVMAAEEAAPLLARLDTLSVAWGFSKFSNYKICLTKYGPGGSYGWRTGDILIKITEGGSTVKKHPAEIILHEAIHIGIEEGIVNKYELTQNEKERLVDLMFNLLYTEEYPEYAMQKRGDRNIDPYVTAKTINDLPRAIESYLKEFPRKKDVV